MTREREQLLGRIEGRTLIDVFMETCDTNGGRPALVAKVGDEFRTWTWGDYRREAGQLAAGLRGLGVDTGDHVALMLANRPEHVISDVATLLAGATPVSVYNTLAPDQVAFVATDCDAVVAIVEDRAAYERWADVRDELPRLRTIVVVDPEGVEVDGERTIAYAQLQLDGARARSLDPAAHEAVWRAVTPDDVVTLIYTSGTTGPPKGVVIDHRNLLYQLAVTQQMLDVQPGQRGISYLPLAHIAERMTTHYLGIRYAGTIYFVRDVLQLLETLLEARPEVLMAVPRVWEKLHAAITAGIGAEEDERRRKVALRSIEVGTRAAQLELRGQSVPFALRLQHELFDRIVFRKMREKLGLDRLKYAISGAAPISDDLLAFYRGIGIEILEVYGMTESTAVITANRPGRVRLGTVGEPIPGTEVQIADDGEVLVRGPHITRGYWRRDDATAEAIDEDGWLHTGDLGSFDDGYLRITGRKKELLITSSGKNLSPTNIEQAIASRSIVIGQMCAVGDDRPYIAALVALDAEMLPLWCYQNDVEFTSVAAVAEHPKVHAEVQRAVDEGNRQLARVEQVKRWVIVPAEWTAGSQELTPSLKLRRSVVHAKYADLIDGLYAAG